LFSHQTCDQKCDMSTEMKQGFFVEEDKNGVCFFSFIWIYGIISTCHTVPCSVVINWTLTSQLQMKEPLCDRSDQWPMTWARKSKETVKSLFIWIVTVWHKPTHCTQWRNKNEHDSIPLQQASFEIIPLHGLRCSDIHLSHFACVKSFNQNKNGTATTVEQYCTYKELLN
jgi:hypothetical protein